jgi:hypothetical protein
MKPIERPGPVDVGLFSPVVTPVETGVSVTTAEDSAMNHSHTPPQGFDKHSATTEYIVPTSTVTRR